MTRSYWHNAPMSTQKSDNPSVPDVNGQPRNWLQPFLLLSLDQWQSHGYELIRRLTLFGFEAIDPGSVYRTLRQLEKDGLLESDWDTTNGGPARRRYSVTEAGRLTLTGWADALRGYQHMLEEFFTQYPAPAEDEVPSADAARASDTTS